MTYNEQIIWPDPPTGIPSGGYNVFIVNNTTGGNTIFTQTGILVSGSIGITANFIATAGDNLTVEVQSNCGGGGQSSITSVPYIAPSSGGSVAFTGNVCGSNSSSPFSITVPSTFTPPFTATFYWTVMSSSATCHPNNSGSMPVTSSSYTINSPFDAFDQGSGYPLQLVYSAIVTDSASRTQSYGPTSCSWCLVPSTLITLQDGTEITLNEISIGDYLFGEDGNKVEAKNTHYVPFIYNINDGLLESSKDHVHILYNGELTKSSELNIGDDLKDKNGNMVKITSIEVKGNERGFEVITISTTNKTYIANGILTHNKTACT